VFITAVPITKLFVLGEGIVEDMCYETSVHWGCYYATALDIEVAALSAAKKKNEVKF
jgi:hypothetical protein